MNVNIDKYELIHSGIIVGIGDYPIKVQLPDEIEGDFTFIMKFVIDPTVKGAVTKYTILDKYTIQIDFNNFNSSMGAGNNELIPLGTLRKMPLFLNYRVFDLVNVSKTLLFNFYIERR